MIASIPGIIFEYGQVPSWLCSREENIFLHVPFYEQRNYDQTPLSRCPFTYHSLAGMVSQVMPKPSLSGNSTLWQFDLTLVGTETSSLEAHDHKEEGGDLRKVRILLKKEKKCVWTAVGRRLILSTVTRRHGRTHISYPTFSNLGEKQKILRKFPLWNIEHVFHHHLCIIRALNTSASQSPKKALVSFLTLRFLFPGASTSALDVSY